VIIHNNQFINPASYGIVIGGGNTGVTFANWSVTGNTIQLKRPGSIALVLRGQVQNSVFSGNTISANGPSDLTAIWSYAAVSGVSNAKIVFQNNRIDKTMKINFSQDPNFSSDCRFQNRDLQGNTLATFPDNSNGQCQ